MNNSKGRKRLVIVIITAAVIMLFAYRFWVLSAGESVSGIAAIHQKEGIPVEVAASRRGDIDVWNTLTGTVEGELQYPIVSTNTLQIVEVLKAEGDRVKPGDLVIRLEKDAPNPMLHSYHRSKAIYDDALKEANRIKDLYNEGAVSKRDLDKAQMALKVAKSDLENAAGSVGLTASNSGIITSIDVKEGDMAVSGKVLAWVARTDSVRVIFKAGSRQAVLLQKGQKAVWKSLYGKNRIEGKIVKLNLSADPKTHLVTGEAEFENPDGVLVPGLVVTIEVQIVNKKDVIKIPADCLIENENGYSVFVVDKGKTDIYTASKRSIKTGVLTSDEVEVVKGLTEGESVVRFGHSGLKDGDRVKVVRGGDK